MGATSKKMPGGEEVSVPKKSKGGKREEGRQGDEQVVGASKAKQEERKQEKG